MTSDAYLEAQVAPAMGLHVDVERRGRNVIVIVSCRDCHTRLTVGTDLERSLNLAESNAQRRPCCGAWPRS